MKHESEVRRLYNKLERMNSAGHLTDREKVKMDALEWVLHDE